MSKKDTEKFSRTAKRGIQCRNEEWYREIVDATYEKIQNAKLQASQKNTNNPINATPPAVRSLLRIREQNKDSPPTKTQTPADLISNNIDARANMLEAMAGNSQKSQATDNRFDAIDSDSDQDYNRFDSDTSEDLNTGIDEKFDGSLGKFINDQCDTISNAVKENRIEKNDAVELYSKLETLVESANQKGYLAQTGDDLATKISTSKSEIENELSLQAPGN